MSVSVFSQNISGEKHLRSDISEENQPIKAHTDSLGRTYIMLGSGWQSGEVIKDLKRVELYKKENSVYKKRSLIYKKQVTLYKTQVDTLESKIDVLEEISQNKDKQLETVKESLAECEEDKEFLYDQLDAQDTMLKEKDEKISRKNKKIFGLIIAVVAEAVIIFLL